MQKGRPYGNATWFGQDALLRQKPPVAVQSQSVSNPFQWQETNDEKRSGESYAIVFGVYSLFQWHAKDLKVRENGSLVKASQFASFPISIWGYDFEEIRNIWKIVAERNPRSFSTTQAYLNPLEPI